MMTKPTTILVVEDERPLLDMLTMLLEDEGYQVQGAHNGREGLARLREGTADLVLSDIMMPEMDGRSLCAAIRADPMLATLPIILMSAAPLGTASEAPSHNAFISKPFRVDALLSVISALLS